MEEYLNEIFSISRTKTPKFPLFIDIRPDKTSNLSKIPHNNFQDVLADKIETNVDQSKTTSTADSAKKFATSQALIQTSLIQQGNKHLTHNTLAKAEFIGDKQNFESVKDPNYVNYAAAFQAGFNASSIEDLKRKKKASTANSETDAPEDDDADTAKSPIEGLTYTHNFNLFGKLSELNPFKKMTFQIIHYSLTPLYMTY